MLIDSVEPIHVVNKYLWSKFKEEIAAGTTAEKARYNYGTLIPIFPVNDSTSGDAKWINRPYFVYTEAFRVTHGLYVMKKSTFVYSLKANVDDHLGWAALLQRTLDRQDDAAADVNDYNLMLKETRPAEYCPVIFHSFRVYQNEPAKPSGSVSTPAVTAHFMVVAEYHLI